MKRLLLISVTFLFFSFIFVANSNAEVNLLQNPGFEEQGESPLYWDEWESGSGVVGDISDTVSHTGSRSVLKELYGRRGIRWGSYSQDVNVSAGKLVTASGWLMSSSSDNPLKRGAKAYIELKFLDESDIELEVYQSDPLRGASLWVQHTISQNAPDDAATARFSFVLHDGGAASVGKVYFDDAVVETEVDTIPPVVTIISPPEGTVVSAGIIPVVGTVDDLSISTIDLSGNQVPCYE